MDIRKYEAFNLQDAIKAIKSDLGRDAVIISTREKEIFSKEKGKTCTVFEVTAASNVSECSRVISPALGEQLQKFSFPKIQNNKEVTVVKNTQKPVIKSTLSTLSKENPKKDFTRSNNTQIDAKNRLINLHENENSRNMLSVEIDSIKQEIFKVRKEIELIPQMDVLDQVQEIKVLLHDIMREKYKKSSEICNHYVVDIGIKLRTAGVSENFISHLTTYLTTLIDPSNKDDVSENKEKIREFYISHAIKFIFKYLKVTGSFIDEKNKQKIICLVGSTGIGKTTTIAKIAAKAKINSGKKVELISMDSYRVAAADQLRVYSKILECPFHETSDMHELSSILSKASNSDCIFIDTPGRSARFPEQLESIKQLMTLSFPIEFHLVLSSTVKQRDIDEIIRSYRFLTISSVIFTKLDESWAFGEILNSSIQSKIPLSYFTTGQRVPEDIEVATKERVVERLLRL